MAIRLEKKEHNDELNSFIKFEAWLNRHSSIILFICFIILFILLIGLCVAILNMANISAVESGTVYNHFDKVI